MAPGPQSPSTAARATAVPSRGAHSRAAPASSSTTARSAKGSDGQPRATISSHTAGS